jgi:DNA-binding response OmpR family regulator
MTPSRVLLLDTRNPVHPELSATLERESEGGITAEVCTAVQEGLDRIAEKGFDTVVCWAEHKNDLIGVIQIRKARSSLPILVLSSQETPGFRALAIQMGATRVAKRETDVSLMARTIRLIVLSGELAHEVQGRAAEVFVRVQEMQLLLQENRTLTREAQTQAGRKSRPPFTPLLVEDDPNQALLMVRAFQKAEVLASLPTMTTGEEAIEYLSRLSDPGHPVASFPSMIIMDLELPRKSGLEVLEWIRGNRAVAHIPVVILSASTNPDHVNRAYQLGAHAYLIKPTSLSALIELVARLAGRRSEASRSKGL